MAIHAALKHTTTYRYDRRIAMGSQIVRLRPAPHCRTPILSYALNIEPKEHFLNWQQDPFGNYLGRIVIPEETEMFQVTVDLVADMSVINPFDFFVEDSAMHWPFEYDETTRQELSQYLTPAPAGPALKKFLSGIDRKKQVTIDFLIALNQRLNSDVKYLIRMEPGVQTTEDTLLRCQGSCRDSAWLMVETLRHLGLAARFVSGYLIQLVPDVKAIDGPVGAATDFTDLHAWAEVYLPGAGWIGLDATSGLLTGEGHIPLAATPQPSAAAPITGGHGVAEVDFSFDMSITRVRETPRVTKPYDDATWDRINATGAMVDARLAKGDVRLSMGGEPTFVAATGVDAPEWNIAAVGPSKRGYADNLLRKLHKRFAPGGLLHIGQGKWYPGEQLPRWAFAIFWRRDGEPMWENPELLCREKVTKPATIKDAEAFSTALGTALGFGADAAMPAHEDAAYFALVEQKLPDNVTIEDNKLADAAERARVVRVFDQGVTSPVGYVLPLQSWHAPDKSRRWITDKWSFRRGKLFLVPGDSPAGFRLPLGSMPYIKEPEYPHVKAGDPYALDTPLPKRAELLKSRQAITLKSQPIGTSSKDMAFGAVRTALTVEPRDGKLCVFLPPVPDGEDYAALIAAIEATAAKLGQQVSIEGYEPPHDPRINLIKVTPDPGVIEINVQPAANWDEAVGITNTLYEEAQHCHLSTEKFMLDGRHTGTGGGNHIVFGGLKPADSPFLRRPDILASIITYWQNHPSLTYMFSGMFIGPTSQAPRLDEARHESLYELEIALTQIPDRDKGPVPPWLVDRTFRHLLIDVTGNTHRAEICIDKMYSPDGPTGRLGLVEFRSFEMPPHARMSLAQQLLLRALIVMFWEKRYTAPLVRWGTALHDRFMLPHFLWSDFKSIIGDLDRAGLPLEADWYRPHLEFRAPVIGAVSSGDIKLEFRQALEPWHVLGEEGSAGAVARYVDSSIERIEVRATGLIGERYKVVCNGVVVPMTTTGTMGEAIAAVRFKAWAPPSALHPSIKEHGPLTFDIYDSWTGRAVAGCRYHVSHPGGRAHDTLPINSYEAEGRRLARFDKNGHTAGSYVPKVVEPHPDFPLTLDLRRSH